MFDILLFLVRVIPSPDAAVDRPRHAVVAPTQTRQAAAIPKTPGRCCLAPRCCGATNSERLDRHCPRGTRPSPVATLCHLRRRAGAPDVLCDNGIVDRSSGAVFPRTGTPICPLFFPSPLAVPVASLLADVQRRHPISPPTLVAPRRRKSVRISRR